MKIHTSNSEVVLPCCSESPRQFTSRGWTSRSISIVVVSGNGNVAVDVVVDVDDGVSWTWTWAFFQCGWALRWGGSASSTSSSSAS